MNLNTDAHEAARETVRRNMHKHVRRVYDTPVACVACKKSHVVSDKTISYLCPHCGKFNTVSEANERYMAGDFEQEYRRSSHRDLGHVLCRKACPGVHRR